MRSVVIPGTGLRTSRLGFGTASLHHLARSRERQDLLAAAWAAGIRHFDTAPLYGHELAERELGRFIQGRRHEMVLTTKLGFVAKPLYARAPALMQARLALGAAARRFGWPHARPAMPRSFDPRTVMDRVEGSLARLRTDYVDVLYLHEPMLQDLHDLEGLVRALDLVRKTGRARYLGLAGHAGDCLAVAAGAPTLAQVLQVEAAAQPGAGLDALRLRQRAPQVSFGHFRSALQRTSFDLQDCLAKAAHDNPDGVILFSSRSRLRLQQTAGALIAVDRDGMGDVVGDVDRP